MSRFQRIVKIRVWREGTGFWHYCNDALGFLDARGGGYLTRNAAIKAAKDRYLDSPDPDERADAVKVV